VLACYYCHYPSASSHSLAASAALRGGGRSGWCLRLHGAAAIHRVMRMYTSTPLPCGWQPLRVSLTTPAQSSLVCTLPTTHPAALPCAPWVTVHTHRGHTHRSTSRQLYALHKHHVHCAASAAARCTRHGTPHTYDGDGAGVTRNPRAVRDSLGGSSSCVEGERALTSDRA
jgi:hypothetical protein